MLTTALKIITLGYLSSQNPQAALNLRNQCAVNTQAQERNQTVLALDAQRDALEKEWQPYKSHLKDQILAAQRARSLVGDCQCPEYAVSDWGSRCGGMYARHDVCWHDLMHIDNYSKKRKVPRVSYWDDERHCPLSAHKEYRERAQKKVAHRKRFVAAGSTAFRNQQNRKFAR